MGQKEFIKALAGYSDELLKLSDDERHRYIDYASRITAMNDINIGGEQLGYFEDNKKIAALIPGDKIVVDVGCGYAWQQVLFRDHKRYIGIQEFAPQNIGTETPKIEALFPNVTIFQKRFKDVTLEELGWTEDNRNYFFGIANHSLWHDGLPGLNTDREYFRKLFPKNYYATDINNKKVVYSPIIDVNLIERRRFILEELAAITFDSILDAGCDKGGNMEWIIKHFPGVKKYGCDIDDGDVIYSKKHFPEFEIIHGDVTNLPYSDSSIDAVICDAVLYQLGNIPPAIKELERVAKKIIIVCDPKIIRFRNMFDSKDYKFIKINEGGSWEEGGIIIWKK